MVNAKQKKNDMLDQPSVAETTSLDLLRRDLTAFLDLHAVFDPGQQHKGPAVLTSITEELTDRVDSIVRLASELHAHCPVDIAKKLEIFAFAYENNTISVQRRHIDRLLQSSIQDLKKLAIND